MFCSINQQELFNKVQLAWKTSRAQVPSRSSSVVSASEEETATVATASTDDANATEIQSTNSPEQ